ncbi:putative Katanin p60 ATPase-containing subunit [Operophtera brumata]|uniref:Putative Katanin p60 ATPase-containing subunit n=1 Tax=Operophtera brumata TaxID=104452 RepID=A0A0L7LMX4_OPEBR|nr:putative Katanin p60 ATPase-containing subunit [Operophtera brumata]
MACARPMSRMRKIETKETIFRTRKRILKYLVMSYLKQECCFQTAETFAAEAAVTDEYEICDNIDLDIILQDYCSYYLIRFNKQPQFCRRAEERPPTRRPPTRKGPRVEQCVETREDPDLPATLAVTRLLQEENANLENTIPAIERKSLASFLSNAGSEKRELVELLYQDIIRPTGVSWDDIKGLSEAKSLLMESVVYPVRYPDMFTGLLEPWRGVLLHGPPGTGKTQLARAVADQSQCTFFNITCGTVVNKWRGESEKIVKVDLETLARSRSSPGEHEASRRLQAQLLTELDGIQGREGIVFLLANSNMPWDIDPAMLRRLEKRISIPLPNSKTRVELFEKFLSSKGLELAPNVNFKELAAKTEGYSGSDIKLVCKEALMCTVRKILPNMVGRNRLDISDILTAIEKTKPVSKNLAKKHLVWQNEMGCS